MSGTCSPHVLSGWPEYQPLLGHHQQLPVTRSHDAAHALGSPRPPLGQLSYVGQQGGSHCAGTLGGKVLQQVGGWVPPQDQACQVAFAHPEAGWAPALEWRVARLGLPSGQAPVPGVSGAVWASTGKLGAPW